MLVPFDVSSLFTTVHFPETLENFYLEIPRSPLINLIMYEPKLFSEQKLFLSTTGKNSDGKPIVAFLCEIVHE